jgi:hypothetical protein
MGTKAGGKTMTNMHSQQGDETLDRMKRSTEITTLFLDVGGVLLTNGWGHQSRALAAKTFDLNLEEMEDRHHLTFDTYEVGKLTLEEYPVLKG